MNGERAKELINIMIDTMIQREGMNVTPVIEMLIDCDFTRDELIDDFYFVANDVDKIIKNKG